MNSIALASLEQEQPFISGALTPLEYEEQVLFARAGILSSGGRGQLGETISGAKWHRCWRTPAGRSSYFERNLHKPCKLRRLRKLPPSAIFLGAAASKENICIDVHLCV